MIFSSTYVSFPTGQVPVSLCFTYVNAFFEHVNTIENNDYSQTGK